MTQTTMQRICAIIDAQGFIQNKRFIVREFAIKTDEIELCLHVNNRMSLKRLSNSDLKTNLYAQQHLHGLSFLPEKGVSWGCIKELLQYYFNGKPYGVKNNQLGNLLREINIPFISLEGAIITKDPRSPKGSAPLSCGKHIDSSRCSLAKVNQLYLWLIKQESW